MCPSRSSVGCSRVPPAAVCRAGSAAAGLGAHAAGRRVHIRIRVLEFLATLKPPPHPPPGLGCHEDCRRVAGVAAVPMCVSFSLLPHLHLLVTVETSGNVWPGSQELGVPGPCQALVLCCRGSAGAPPLQLSQLPPGRRGLPWRTRGLLTEHRRRPGRDPLQVQGRAAAQPRWHSPVPSAQESGRLRTARVAAGVGGSVSFIASNTWGFFVLFLGKK